MTGASKGFGVKSNLVIDGEINGCSTACPRRSLTGLLLEDEDACRPCSTIAPKDDENERPRATPLGDKGDERCWWSAGRSAERASVGDEGNDGSSGSRIR